MAELLFILRLPEAVRARYLDGMRAAFPGLVVNAVEDRRLAAPFLPTADAIATFGPMVDDEVFRAAPRLQWVQALGTGVDGIVDQPSLGKEVVVTNAHGFHGPPMAEATLMAMLAQARDFPRALRNQAQAKWERWPVHTLHESTVGILGVGAIAEALAARCKAFGMTVVGISSTPRALPHFDRMEPTARLLQAVRDLDWLVVLTPLRPDTRHLVGREVFAAMKPTAFLVNVARGGVVDEAALLAALERRQLAGAALDVFQAEPLPPDSPWWQAPNVLVTSHAGGFFDRYPDHALPILERNMRAFLAGKREEMIHVIRG
jgi:phosphoglycerate dehydrogenase-like enzyme